MIANELFDRNLSSLFNSCFGTRRELESLTPLDYDKLRRKIESKVAPNSVRTYCARIRARLSLLSIPEKTYSPLHAKREETISVYLTQQELQQIERAENLSDKQRFYSLYFLCSALSGLRVSDVQRISERNIDNGMLRYVAEKTGVKVEVPVSPKIPLYLGRIKEYQFQLSERDYNRQIKIVCQKVGIDSEVMVYRAGRQQTGQKWQFVSTHTARRSFATNLYLRGLDIFSISKMMGHSSVETTRNYICCGLRNMPSEVMDYFNQ